MKVYTLLDQRVLHEAMLRLRRTLVNLTMIVASALAAAGTIELAARLTLATNQYSQRLGNSELAGRHLTVTRRISTANLSRNPTELKRDH